MTAKQLIQALFEAANLDQGLMSLEFEFVLRKDLKCDEFVLWLGQHGYTHTEDPSVEITPGSLEAYYKSTEIAHMGPDYWSVIKPKTEAVLAFLKREDVVVVKRSRYLDETEVHPTVDIFTGKPIPEAMELLRVQPQQYKLLRLPRAVAPKNFTAGTHIHFDAETWFKSAAHAHQLVATINQMRKEFPQHVPVKRYSEPDQRGRLFATTDKLPEPSHSRFSTAKGYLSAVADAAIGRFFLLNTKPVLAPDRGDIEFRFLHSTLNFQTVEMWYRTLAEMLLYAEQYTGDFANFRQWSAKEAPEVDQFLKRSNERHWASQDVDYGGKPPTKAVRRVLTGLAKKSGAKGEVSREGFDRSLEATKNIHMLMHEYPTATPERQREIDLELIDLYTRSAE